MSEDSSGLPPYIAYAKKRAAGDASLERRSPEQVCINCGYSLRGLDMRGKCPECGADLSRSAYGDRLFASNRDWLKRLYYGINLIAIAILALLGVLVLMCGVGVVFAVYSVPTADDSSLFDAWVTLLFILPIRILALVGYWLFTSPEPRKVEFERALSLRRTARWLVLSALLQAWVPIVVLFYADALGTVLLITFDALAGVAGSVAVVCMLLYAGTLVDRAPDRRLARSCRIVAWGLGAVLMLTVVNRNLVYWEDASGGAFIGEPGSLMIMIGCFMAMPALVFWIWSIVLVFKLRSLFKDVAFY